MKALAMSLVTRSFGKQVGAFQESLYQYAAGVLQQLNATMQTVASVAPGHLRPVRSHRPRLLPATTRRARDGWVFAPRAKGDVTVNWHGVAAAGRHFNFQPHTLCVPQQPAPACNVDGADRRLGHQEGDALKVGPVSAQATVTYSFSAVLNDFPHLTPNGQAALAGKVRASLAVSRAGGVARLKLR